MRCLKLAAAFLIAFCAMYYFGEFSQRQSIALACLAALFCWVSFSTAEVQTQFVPFSVYVVPNLHALVTDLGLVDGTENGWAEIRAGIERLPKEPSNIWHSGFSFTFVTPTLIYLKDWNRFASEEVELFADLAPVQIPFFDPKDNAEIDRPHSPHLTLRASREIGGVLTLTVPTWFWETKKNSEVFKHITKNDVSEDHMCGTVDVRLLRIPVAEFAVHQALLGASSDKEWSARKEARLKYGWTGKSQSDMYGSESGADRSNVAEHKYCALYHDAI
jgi:hypothetical protein